VHKCEGRVFLTDRNGFYDDVLANQFQSTKGNVVIVLTSASMPTTTSSDSDTDALLCNEDDVATMIKNG